MKTSLIFALFLALTPFAASAQTCPTCLDEPPVDEGNNPTTGPGPTQPDLKYHGGATMQYARVVYIFWGALPAGYASELQAYRDTFAGMADHLGMLAQYNAPQTSLTSSQADIFDATTPPSEVTDTAAALEVQRWFLGRFDSNAVYVIVLPNGVVSSKKSESTSAILKSCAGTQNGQYCAYHRYFKSGTVAYKYAVVPYSSCSNCKKYAADGVAALDFQNAEIMTIHEVREAMTNPELNAWFDTNGLEADDKCAYIVDGAFRPANIFYGTVLPMCGVGETCAAYHTFWFQKEWSNSAHSCVE